MHRDSSGSTVNKNLPASAGVSDSIPGQVDSTCFGATKPVCHNYRALTLEPARHNYGSPCALEPRALQQEKPTQ